MEKNIKGISPVVAIALLLVVAVVAVVSFQSWFTGYQSSIFSDTEIKSNQALDGSLVIDKLIGNWLYIINNIEDGLNVTQLKIGGNVCTLDNLTLGMNEVNVTDCVSGLSTSTPDIVLITKKQIVSKKVLVDNVASNTLFECIGTNVLLYNDVCWQKNMSSAGLMQWTDNANFLEPTWNDITNSYLYPNGTINNYPAFEYCENLILDGYTDWRLPTTSNWDNLIGASGYTLTNVTSKGFVGAMILIPYWESNLAGGFAGAVRFDNDGLFGAIRTNTCYVTCVRS